MTENENLEKQIADDLSAVLKEAKEMGCKEVAYFRHIPLQNVETVVNALYEIQQYRKSLKNKHIGKDNMVISSSDLMKILNTDSDKELEAYRAIGTVEEIQKKFDELDRWHTDRINENIKNPFAYTSTLVCHNCDHKDEYIEELEAENAEFKSIGTVEEIPVLFKENHKAGFDAGYAKGIDEFVDAIDKHTFTEKIETNYSNSVSFMREIKEIAEQLKGGV